MGTVNSNFLPATPGLNIGSPSQAWNGFFTTLTMLGLYQTVGFSTTPTFTGTGQISIFDITLTGNVTSSTLVAQQGIIVFIIRQDATGLRTFTWPANVFGGSVIGSAANQITTESFACDGTNAYSIGGAGIYP